MDGARPMRSSVGGFRVVELVVAVAEATKGMQPSYRYYSHMREASLSQAKGSGLEANRKYRMLRKWTGACAFH